MCYNTDGSGRSEAPTSRHSNPPPESNAMSAAPKKQATWKGSRPKHLTRLSGSVYQQASWTRDDLVFSQHLPSRTCSCEAGEKGHWCKHLSSAFVASFVDSMEVARQMPGQLRRKLLKQQTHAGRPDIEMALLVAEWEEQRDQQNEGAPPEGGHPVRRSPAEHRALGNQERRENDAAKVAGWQRHSEEVAQQAAENDAAWARAL